MFEKRLTLLIIPEEGEKTHEFKVPRAVLWAVGLCLLCGTGLIAVGMYSFAQSRDLEKSVVQLQREKLLLEAEVEQIDQLEQVLLRLQRSNEQLRAILGDWDEGDAQGNATGSGEPFISAQRRLNWGYVESVPTAWPLAGPLLRSFSPAFQAVVIAAVEGSPVCASASGTVVRAGYDTLLGQLIIIDHGNGIETHYGYNSALFVSEGEHILKGQHIAHSGRGGRAPYEGLYYAVREGRAFRDPIYYRLWL
jgi:murein DD-endopeptidase MepM/ murein hydrolase activator NlpD